MARPCSKDHSIVEGLKIGCRICQLCADPGDVGKQHREFWQEEEVKEVGLFGKLKNFGKALIKHTLAGLPILSEEDKKVRLEICHGCKEGWIEETKTCRFCGCNLEVKAGWAKEVCPLGRWPVVREWPIKFDEHNLAKGESGLRFNSSLIEYNNGYLLAYRNGWCGSEISLIQLDSNFTPVGPSIRLDLFHPKHANYGREDPRLFRHLGKLYVGYVGVVGGNNLSHTSMLYARIDDSLRVERVFYPEYKGRNYWEKNWGFFSYGSDLLSVYSISPHRILKVVDDKSEIAFVTNAKLGWVGGELRGGSSPVRVGEEYYSFFHDRVEVNGHRVYRMGLYTFEARPPFRVKRIIPYPLMTADRDTKPSDQYASVVFPGGAIRTKDHWVIAMGIHDKWCELHRFSVRELESKLVKVE